MHTGAEDNPPDALLRRRNQRPRLDPFVYGPSGLATHVNIGAYNRRPVLTANPKVAALILQCLQAAAAAQDATLYCYCLMPDHLHFIAAIERGGTDIPTLVKSFSIRLTRRTRDLCSERLLQRSFYDVVIRPERDDLVERCGYVVNNPVRKELVRDWHDYPYAWLHQEMGS